jgi:hypothetical protein
MRNSTSWSGWSLIVQTSSLAAATNYAMQRAKKSTGLFSHALRYQIGRKYLLVVVAFFLLIVLHFLCFVKRTAGCPEIAFLWRIGSSLNTTVILMGFVFCEAGSMFSFYLNGRLVQGFCWGYCILGTDCKRDVRGFAAQGSVSA